MRKVAYMLPALWPAFLVLSLALTATAASAQSRQHCGVLWPCTEPADEFEETFVIIEINATDGDVGFHALFDGEPWTEVMMMDPTGTLIFGEFALGGLAVQGLTENFFESAEPLCEFDDEEPDAEVVTLAEFLGRFPAGEYTFAGMTIDGNFIMGAADFTYDIPAAPDIDATEDAVFGEGEPVVVMWAPGDDLGDKCHDQSLVDDGTIADPADVEVVRWEVVVEPDDEEAADPLRVYSVQLPPDQTSITVPEEFLAGYLADGYNVFKFEVGAREESGNQVFSEGNFEIECPACEGDDDE